MTTRMVHPLHGATHAYDVNEIERLKGWGWSVEVPAAPVAEEVLIPVLGVAEGRDEQTVTRKKPGPKPKAK